MHVNVLKDAISEERWKALIPPLQEEIYHLALSLGGTLTGEHGVGATRRNFLPLAVDPPQIEIMRRIREIFDPNEILNPGKIFPFKRRAC